MVRALWLPAVLVGLPALAQAQHVTVEFVQAPVGEVLAELQRQTGARVYDPFQDGPDEPLVDVQVQDAPLRAVLQAVGEQTGCYCRGGRGYFELKLLPDPMEMCPSAKAGPYIVRVRSVHVAHSWTLGFEGNGGGPVVAAHEMSVELQVEADEERDIEALAAFHPAVQAITNAGETVAPKERELPRHLILDRSYVHQGYVRHGVKLNAPPPEAASLQTLEGDLVVRRNPRVLRLTFPLADGPGAQDLEGHTFTVTGIEATGGGGCEISGEWELAPDPGTGVGLPGRLPFYNAYLVAADGARALSSRRDTRVGRREDGQSILRCDWQFDAAPTLLPEDFVFEWAVTDVETELVHYRIEDVVLPTWEE